MTEPALLGTLLDGKFQLEKALASGASGDVYEAMHLGLGARVAVKVLRPGIPETAEIRRKRFMREARVAARIQSDHVVRVFDIVAPEKGETYIVMELLEGETLAARAQRLGRLPIADAVDYVLQAAPRSTSASSGTASRTRSRSRTSGRKPLRSTSRPLKRNKDEHSPPDQPRPARHGQPGPPLR